MLGATLTIAAKDLRQRLRDRSAIVLGFVAPLLIATLMNFAFGGTEEFHARLAVADEDGGPIATQVVATLRSPGLADVVTLSTVADRGAARRAVDGGDADAAVVIPEGFTAAVAGDGPVALDVLTSVDQQLAGEVARSIATAFTTQLSGTRLAVAAALAAGAPHGEVERIVADAVAQDPPVVAVERPTGDRQLKGVAYYGPGMAMFFVLFAIGFTARGFFLERREGTLDRIAAAPLRPAAVLAGKALSVFAYALASLLTVSLVTGLVFRASWGSPAGVAVLCLGMAVAVVALAALVMSVARTERQAETLSSALTFALALLGGNFVFIGAAPEALRRLAAVTPNGLALRGFTDLATGVPTAEAVRLPLLGMLAFTAVVGALAALGGRRAVVR